MTINATAAWLLGLYVANAEEQGVDSARAARHDAERHRQGVPVARHVHLPARAVAAADRRHGRLVRRPRPAVEPDQRLLATTCRRRGRRRCRRSPTRWRRRSACSTPCATRARSPHERFAAGVRLDLVLRQRRHPLRRGDLQAAGVHRAVGPHRARALRRRPTRSAPRFRYGVQVNSLGLTEAQPENNVQRIVLEMLGVTLSKRARARCIQLPAWNEALGLPRPWDQQWSLRMQQVLAYETDLLEYDDIFDGSHVVEAAHRRAAATRPRRELDDVLALGGAFEAVDELKSRLVRSMAERTRRIESGEQIGRRRQPLHRDRAVAARRRGRDPERRPRRRGGGGRRRATPGAPPATPPPSTPRSTSCARPPRAATTSCRPSIALARRRRHDRRVGRGDARGVRRVPRPRPASAPPQPHRRRGLGEVARAGAGAARRTAPAARRQAGPRRPLQRRRADRRRRPRRRHGGHLLRASA